MGRHIVEATATTTARPEAVWEVIADVSGWQEWGPYSDTYRERGGEPANGVGAVRVYAVGPFKSRERVVRFDPPAHFAYEILSGFPARDYRADVTLEALPGEGTRIHWLAQFDPEPRGTGWLLERILNPYLGFLARKSGQVAADRLD